MQREELRWRGKADRDRDTNQHPGTVAAKRPRSKFRIEWDLIFWMFGSFAMLYFTDFASHLLFNPIVKWWWLLGSVLLFATCIGCLVRAMRTRPTLNTTNWKEQAPILIAVATVSILTGAVGLGIAIWPVWKLYTLLMIPTLFMGFVSTVSLFNL